jgi:hypothetical protein
MSKSIEKILAATLAILMIISLASIFEPTVKATTVSEIGHTDPNTPGFPNLPNSPPAGVTPGSSFDTGAYISMRPNPIGVGQSLLVNVWLSPGTYHAFPMTGLKVDIIKPDGTTMTVGPFNTYTGDSTAWFEMIPDQVGTWQFKMTFAGTYIAAGQYWDQPGSETGGFVASGKYLNIGSSIYYKPEETGWYNLTVQENMVSSWPATPSSVFNDYWTRPINPMWRDLGQSIGDYPFNTLYYYSNGRILYPEQKYRFTPYVTGPNSAHVLWKRTLDTTGPAGMVGGYTWDYSLAPNPGTPSIVYAGRAYQSITKAFDNGSSGTVFQCYDLKTGQVYWERALLGATPNIIEYSPPGSSTTIGNEADQGWQINLIAISGSQLYKYNPATGAQTANVSIAPISGGTYYMPGYALTIQDLGSSKPAADRYRLINWTTYGTSTNFTTRIAGNISWTRSSLTGSMGGAVDYEANLAASVAWNTPPGPQWGIGTEIIVTDLLTGKDVWHYQTNDTLDLNIQGTSSSVWYNGKLAFDAHNRHWSCFNGRTGQKVWTSESTEYPWGAWWPYSVSTYPFNETDAAIITGTYEGIYAINWADGKILWHYSTESFAVPFEGPYNAEPFFTGVTLADGKVYAYNGEHTPSYPRDRAWSLYCIDVYTGQEIWKIRNPMTPGAVADGCLTAGNPYDGYMYVFGKGPSTTTVTASPKTLAQGAQILIEGTIMDQSPAQAGTPCVSKNSMSLEMEHIHMSMPISGLWGNETITGVPVVLTAIAADGTVIDLGTATTNGYSGNFAFAWTPPKEGIYTLMASFAGDDSYGSSTAYTSVSVGPSAATVAPTQSPPPQVSASDVANQLMTPLAIVAVAIIIAIAIATVLIIRRK